MKKIIFFLIIFLIFCNKFFSNTNASSEFVSPFCENKIKQNYIENFDKLRIKKIEIDNDDYRKWTVNSTRIITNSSRFTPEKYKKRFNAKILVTYENNIQCIFKGRIRHSGDAKDHIGLQGNTIIQSLDVHLNDDRDKKYEENAAENFARTKRFLLDLVKSNPPKGKKRSIRSNLKRVGWDKDYLVSLLFV